MSFVKICKTCNKSFIAKHPATLYCCKECRDIDYARKAKEKLLEGQEGIDYVICKWCGEPTPRIYGKHIKIYHPSKTSEDYRSEFPGSKMCCENDKISTSANSGKFMKEEKYRKLFSEMWKGDKNPNSKVNRSDEERKAASPFSIEFYLKRGFSLEESEVKVHEFAKNAIKDRITNTDIRYYLNKGMSEEEAKNAFRERQSTFSLEKCIKKYGEEEGKRIYNERQNKWYNSLVGKGGKLCGGLSSAQAHLFEELKKIDENLIGINEEYSIYDKDNCKTYKYDITDKQRKKIIEFNGSFWHCKPGLYDEDFFHPILKITAKEKWDYDEMKIDAAKKNGFEVLIVWDDDFKNNEKEIIDKCISFLFE